MQRVNYDRIADLYDEPLRDHAVDPHLVAFLNESSSDQSGTPCILDLGCGTGKQLIADHTAFPQIPAVGLDLFRGMLRIARTRCPDVRWVRGDGVASGYLSARLWGHGRTWRGVRTESAGSPQHVYPRVPMDTMP